MKVDIYWTMNYTMKEWKKNVNASATEAVNASNVISNAEIIELWPQNTNR